MTNKNQNTEEWKDVVGYEGLYQISNLGNVKSLEKDSWNGHKTYISKEKILKVNFDKDGYRKVTLYKNKKPACKRVARLVGEAFVSNPHNYPIINHKDENKQNDKVENLEWCTKKYNTNYGSCQKKKALSLQVAVLKVSSTGEIIERYNSVTEASIKNNVCKATICKYCKGIKVKNQSLFFKYERG